MNITLRPATDSDLDWLDPFYESVMKPYVELTHVWDENKFRKLFDPRLISVIRCEEKDIGMQKTEIRPDCLYLSDIQIRPEYQKKGIGGSLVKKLISQAAELRLPLKLRVLKGNPAIQFYQRFGFAIVQELDHCFELKREVEPCRPANAAKLHR